MAPGNILESPSIASLSIKPLIAMSFISPYKDLSSSVVKEKASDALFILLATESIEPSRGVFLSV